jgi:carboxyl-terminal processing protease
MNMRKTQALLLALLVGIVSALGTYFLVSAKYETRAEDELPLTEFLRVEKEIKENYLRDFEMEDVQYAGLKAMVASLGDPYSVYYTPEEFAAFQQNSSGEYYGVGMGITIDDVTGLAVVSYFLEDSAAEEAGIQVGDFIVSIDGTDVTKNTLQEIRVKCIGEDGTPITIGVKRGDEVLEFTMARRSIELDMVEYKMLEGGIGYMRIKQFSGNCEALFHEGMDEFEKQGAKGIVFDLRNNPGGYLNTVVSMLDRLLPEGKIVYTEDKYGNQDIKTSDADCNQMPMVLLVNGNTASASEIFAGAIQDYDWGEVVGTRTYGKGVVQVVIPIESTGGGLKITSSEYFTPKGRSIDGNGVYPDKYVELPSDAEEDMQLKEGLSELASLISKNTQNQS